MSHAKHKKMSPKEMAEERKEPKDKGAKGKNEEFMEHIKGMPMPEAKKKGKKK